MSDHLESSVEQGIYSVRLNRPAKKNALTLAMYEGLAAALKDAEKRADVRVLWLSGNGDCFTAGNDLMDFAGNPPTGEDSPVIQFLLALAAFSKPLVASVDGSAIGIGSTLLLHCDVVYASDRAKFSLPFVNLALCPEAASSLLLPARAGALRASELLLFGEPFDGAAAVAAGLVTRVVPAGELAAYTKSRCEALAAKPPAALRATKRLMKEPGQASVLEALKREAGVFIERLQSPEAQEAFTAFMEKRKPDFSQF